MGAGGRSSMDVAASAEPNQLMQRLAQDPQYAPFYEDTFDVAQFVSSSLTQSSIAARGSSINVAQTQIDRIQEGVTLLDGVVRAEVTRRQAELLQQASQLRDAESYLASVNTSTDNLRTTLNRVRGDIVEPYKAIASRTQQLQNLLTTANLLRHATQALKLLAKLKAQLGPDGRLDTSNGGMLDLAKSAKLISDIEAVLQEVSLQGVEAIDTQLPMLEAAKANVRWEAKKVLCSGMEGMNQAEAGSALQVLFNLQEMQQTVQAVLQGYVERVDEAFSTAVDTQRLTTTSGHSAARVQDALWSGLSRAFSQLQSAVVQVCLLQRVLGKKKDPLTHVLFLDEVTKHGQQPPLTALWSKLARIVRRCFEGIAGSAAGGLVKEVLLAQYPRLALLVEDTASNIQRDTEIKGSAPPALDATQTTQLLQTTASLQQAYLAACVQRLTDSAVAAFPGGARALPPAAELQKCIARIHDEVKLVNSSPRLATLITQSIGSALITLAGKAEYMAVTGPDARTLGSGATAAQQRNITLVNGLQEVHRSMVQLLQKLPPEAHGHLRQPLEAVRAAAVEVATPLFKSLVDAAETQVLKMHTEDINKQLPTPPLPPTLRGGGSGGGGGVVRSASGYMVGLTKMMGQWRSDYITRFTPLPTPTSGSIAATLVERMAARMVYFFVRHASLQRPLTAEGRGRLARDAQELEASINQYLYPCEHLGAPFRMLRAFRPLLTTQPTSLPGSPLLRALPVSVVLHHLYTWAPEVLQSPHARSGLTAAQYSVWLDQHSMEEVVAGIRKALEGDREKVVEQEVLEVMLTLCGGQG